MARLTDGHSTRIDFANAPTLPNLIAEKTVTPLGMSAGGENDITTMRNIRFRTRAPKKLITMKDAGAKTAYDPEFYTILVTILGINQLITITFSNGGTLQFWGWLDEVTPDESQEGSQPTANMKVIASNINDSGVETAPVYTPPS